MLFARREALNTHIAGNGCKSRGKRASHKRGASSQRRQREDFAAEMADVSGDDDSADSDSDDESDGEDDDARELAEALRKQKEADLPYLLRLAVRSAYLPMYQLRCSYYLRTGVYSLPPEKEAAQI